VLSGTESPDTGEVLPGHGLRLGYYAQEHDTLDTDRTVLENMRSSSPDLAEPEARGCSARSCSAATWCTRRPARCPAARRPARLATLVVSGANVLLLDEPTNNLDPASREEVLGRSPATRARSCWSPTTRGASSRCSREGAAAPDGVEDQWSDDFADLVALA
jgi:ATPase subunit of ABC transporter with duplicated ATPase domains